jgi:hypothetical protein
VSDLEHIVSRYLDGALSHDELRSVELLLAESAEARTILREMTAIRRAARMEPLLRTPSSRTEAQLFHRLRAEGFGNGAHQANSARLAQTVIPPSQRRRKVIAGLSAVMAVLLVAIIGSEYWPQPASQSGAGGGIAAVVSTDVPVGVDRGIFIPAPLAMLIHNTSVSHRTRNRTSGSVNQLMQEDVPQGGNAGLHDSMPVPVPSPSDPVASINAPSQQLALDAVPVPERLLPPSIQHERSGDASLFAAAVRSGGSYLDRGNGATATEMRLRVDARLGENHRLSLLAGRSASLNETRAQGTNIFVSRPMRPDEDLTTRLASMKPVMPYEMAVQQEFWGGVGYSYSVQTPLKSVRVGVGASAGMGEQSWRFGVELPLSVRMSKVVSVEIAPSASRIIPRDRSVSRFTIENSPDGILYEAESERPVFTSMGVEVGIRVDIP